MGTGGSRMFLQLFPPETWQVLSWISGYGWWHVVWHRGILVTFTSIFTRSIAPQFIHMICALFILFPCDHGPKEIFKGSFSRSPTRGGRGRGARVRRKRRALLWTLAIQIVRWFQACMFCFLDLYWLGGWETIKNLCSRKWKRAERGKAVTPLGVQSFYDLCLLSSWHNFGKRVMRRSRVGHHSYRCNRREQFQCLKVRPRATRDIWYKGSVLQWDVHRGRLAQRALPCIQAPL